MALNVGLLSFRCDAFCLFRTEKDGWKLGSNAPTMSCLDL